MRFLFLLLLLAGAALGFVYPWANARLGAHELGTFRAYDAATGFRPVTARLSRSDAPVGVVVDLTAARQVNQPPQAALLTLTAATGGRTVLAEALSFSGAPLREASPQEPQKTWRDRAGAIVNVTDGDYVFTLGPGDADGIRIAAVDLVLTGGAGEVDPRARPVGTALMAIGAFGLLLWPRSGGRPQNPNSQPPPPRWGRASKP